MKSLLVHACCAHCAAYTIDYWRQQGYAVSTLWYNPNIHPYQEHQHRLESVKALAREMNFPLIADDTYDLIKYFRRVTGHEDERCRHCYELRMGKTATIARQRGDDAFTSTLLISHQQQHEAIREMGERAAAQEGVTFLYADLRRRYSDSRRMTKPLELYRQQYCGCVYSEWERYRDAADK